MTYLIQSYEGEAVPHYLMNARGLGASQAWTTEAHVAMKFDSAEQAEEYVGKKLPTMRVAVVKHG